MHTFLNPSYTHQRFPTEIMRYAVWRSVRFALRSRDVDERLAERGIDDSYEPMRQWCQTFGQHAANHRRRRRAQMGDTWHLDAVFLKINGTMHDLWRAVDPHGQIRDSLVQSRRNNAAARTFFRKLLKRCQYVPRVRVTATRARYGAATADVLPPIEHHQHTRRNNRAEHAHPPTRQRERVLRRFTSAGIRNACLPHMG